MKLWSHLSPLFIFLFFAVECSVFKNTIACFGCSFLSPGFLLLSLPHCSFCHPFSFHHHRRTLGPSKLQSLSCFILRKTHVLKYLLTSSLSYFKRKAQISWIGILVSKLSPLCFLQESLHFPLPELLPLKLTVYFVSSSS